MQLFRTDISPEEEQEFRQWARDNYTPFEMITGLWHPIVQDECRIMNQEATITCEELSRDYGVEIWWLTARLLFDSYK